MYNGVKITHRKGWARLVLAVFIPVPLLFTALTGTTCNVADAAAVATVAATTTNVPATLSGTISYGFSYTVNGGCAGCQRSEDLNVTMEVTGTAISGSLRSSYASYNLDNPDVYHCAVAGSRGNDCFWVTLRVAAASLHYHFASRLAKPNGCHAYTSATGTYKAASTPLPLGLSVVFNPGSTSPAGADYMQPPPPLVPSYGLAPLPPANSYRALGDINLQMAMSYSNRAAASACGVSLPGSVWDLGVEFVGRYHPGVSAFTGTVQYQGLGSPRLSWDLSLEATGLEITSPAASAVIALTDGNFFSPQPGPDQSTPKSRQLTVKGTDTSPGASVVRMGRVTTTIASDGAWSLRLPVSGTGARTLTADDNAGAKADEKVTVIDLVITSPSEGSVLPITAVPTMPALGAVAGVLGYPGNVSVIEFSWALSVRGEYRDRCGHNPDASCGRWYPYNNLIGSGTTRGMVPWAGDFSTIEGGFARLSASAYIPGVLDEPVKSEPRWVDIPGTNPSIASVRAYVAKQDPANAPVEDELFCHESAFTQFRPSPEAREPATTAVPHDIGQNPGPLRPLYGAPYAGVGIAQKDPSSFPSQQWDWHANVDAGIAVYQEDLAGATLWRQAEQVRLSEELMAALQVVNRQRTLEKMKPLSLVPRKVPPLTPAEVQREAIRRYNGEHEYRFDLNYVVSADRLDIKTVGKGKWVEGVGEWEDNTIWRAAGGPFVARRWVPGQNPGYVVLVKACNL